MDGETIQQCLEQHELCDGIAACEDGSDEDVNADGTWCVIKHFFVSFKYASSL